MNDDPRRSAAAILHEKLDDVLLEISELRSAKVLEDKTADDLEKQGTVIRYQIRQLREAGIEAVEDIKSGLELACTQMRHLLRRAVPTGMARGSTR